MEDGAIGARRARTPTPLRGARPTPNTARRHLADAIAA